MVSVAALRVILDGLEVVKIAQLWIELFLVEVPVLC